MFLRFKPIKKSFHFLQTQGRRAMNFLEKVMAQVTNYVHIIIYLVYFIRYFLIEPFTGSKVHMPLKIEF